MRLSRKGIILAMLQLAIVASLAAKYATIAPGSRASGRRQWLTIPTFPFAAGT